MTQIDQYQFKFPVDLSKCMQHRLATRIFKGLQEDNTGTQCQCCGRKVGVQIVQTSCCYSNLQLSFLGPGIPLLFSYIIYSIITLLILSIVFSLFALITNILGEDCGNLPNCSGNIFNTLSIINKINNQDYLSVQNYVLLVFVIIFILILQVFRTNFRKIKQMSDQTVDTPSDYAVILRRLPPFITKQSIKQMIDQYKGFLDQQQKKITQNLKIVNIILSYNMDDYILKKQENLTNFKKFVKQFNPNNFQPQPLPQLTQTSSIAIIVFAKQQSKQILIYKPNICQKILACCCEPLVPLSNNTINQKKIAIQRAPQPDDIIWENANIPLCKAILRKIIFNLISFCILVIGGAVQYGLAVAQNNQQNERIKLIYSFGASLIVAGMNKIIQFFLDFSSKMEKNQTLTQYNKVLMIKISFFLFLNSGVFLVAANIIANNSQFRLQGSLSYQITLVMILNAITPNLTVFFVQTCNLFGKIQVWIIKKQIFNLTQRQANKLYETSYPQIPYKYGYVIKTLWLSAFYAAYVPIVVPISIIGLTFNYWLQKYSYAKAYTAPNMISSMVNDAAIELLQWFTFILCCGQLILYLYFYNFHFQDVPNYWSIPIYISLALSILLLFLPMNQINKKLFKLKNDSIEYPQYDSIQQKFQVTYQMTNPSEKSKRRRKRDRNLWNLLFSNLENKPYQQKQLNANTMKQFLLKPSLPGQIQNLDNPFNMIKINEQQYPNINPMQLINNQQNIYPSMQNQNL